MFGAAGGCADDGGLDQDEAAEQLATAFGEPAGGSFDDDVAACLGDHVADGLGSEALEVDDALELQLEDVDLEGDDEHGTVVGLAELLDRCDAQVAELDAEMVAEFVGLPGLVVAGALRAGYAVGLGQVFHEAYQLDRAVAECLGAELAAVVRVEGLLTAGSPVYDDLAEWWYQGALAEQYSDSRAERFVALADGCVPAGGSAVDALLESVQFDPQAAACTDGALSNEARDRLPLALLVAGSASLPSDGELAAELDALDRAIEACLPPDPSQELDGASEAFVEALVGDVGLPVDPDAAACLAASWLGGASPEAYETLAALGVTPDDLRDLDSFPGLGLVQGQLEDLMDGVRGCLPAMDFLLTTLITPPLPPEQVACMRAAVPDREAIVVYVRAYLSSDLSADGPVNIMVTAALQQCGVQVGRG